MADFIQGQKFKSLADFRYAPQRGRNADPYRNDINNFSSSDYRYLTNTLDMRGLKDKSIIYTHTFYIDQLFELLEKADNKVIVITHNADNNVDICPPENVLIWFTQNVNIKHKCIQSIPIGIENDIWYPDKKDKMLRKVLKRKIFKNLLYINHNIKNNVEKRLKPYEVLGNRSWVTTGNGINGQGFDIYLDNLYNHPFVVCPEGNGMDTHRVWECLYIGTIPIQIRNINNQFYTDLPILFIDDWEEITERFLHDEYMRIVDGKWNRDKLWFSWWKNEILKWKN